MNRIERLTLKAVVFILFILLPLSLIASGDVLKFERLSAREGFPEGTVSGIVQDSQGFMWFCTVRGVYRYDGSVFSMYSHKSNDPGSLGHKYACRVFEDSSGVLWVSTGRSLDRFDRLTETFRHYSDEGLIFSVICESRIEPGILWLGSGQGVRRFNKKNGVFTSFKHEPEDSASLACDYITAIVEDSSGTLWVGSQMGLHKFDRKEQNFVRYRDTPGAAGSISNISNNYIESIYESPIEPGILWIGTRDGLNKFLPEKETFIHYKSEKEKAGSLSNNSISFITGSPVEPGILWIGTMAGGLNKFNRVTGKSVQYRSRPGITGSLGNSFITSVYQDLAGVLWVGTRGGGLFKANPLNKAFSCYRLPAGDTGTLVANKINCIWESLQDSNILWLGSYRGLYRYNRKTAEFTSYRSKFGSGRGLSHDYVQMIREYESEPGVLWIRTYTGLDRFNPAKNTWGHYLPDDGADCCSIVSAFHRSPGDPGVFWIATGKGLIKLILKTKKMSRYRMEPEGSGNKSSDRLEVIYESSLEQDYLWLGSYDGLHRFDKRDGSFDRFRAKPVTAGFFSGNIITFIMESKGAPGFFWVGSDKGLLKFDRERQVFVDFKNKSKLSNFLTIAALEDGRHDLWISTYGDGLIKYNTNSGEIRLYDVRDGLQGSEFSEASFKSKSGELFFGGVDGLNAFFPGEIRDNQFAPPIVITDFLLFNRTVKRGMEGQSGSTLLEKSITETKAIGLCYRENVLTFNYVALNYVFPDKNKYAYKMEGFDADWHYVGGRRFATYTSLEPGPYVFRVKGCNNDGIWNEEGTSLKIYINPPWWRRGWAYAAGVLLLMLFIFAVDHFQRVRLIKRERHKTEVREAELRARAAEAQAKALEAESKRKTHELEEARKLQLSMLPRVLPELLNLDIGVYMETAAEVGGDYYDFRVDEDGSLTVLIGDATGHGLKAGTMVAMTKAIFHSRQVLSSKAVHLFKRINRVFKDMRLGNLFMALTAVYIKGNRWRICAAGMPPVLIYRSKEQVVEEIIIKAPPLGAFNECPSKVSEVEMAAGDIMLLFSDGMPEAFDPEEEMYGYRRMLSRFKSAALQETPDKIIDELVHSVQEWLAGQPQADDITFGVLKVKK
ncbi:MAG: SpoIIE family protein phosphatase [bacterium]|nr:SpoIIE family protein phosphatase [bacterium]